MRHGPSAGTTASGCARALRFLRRSSNGHCAVVCAFMPQQRHSSLDLGYLALLPFLSMSSRARFLSPPLFAVVERALTCSFTAGSFVCTNRAQVGLLFWLVATDPVDDVEDVLACRYMFWLED